MKTLNQIQSELSPETWDDLVQHFALQKQAFSEERTALEAAMQTALREKAQAVQSANLADAARVAAEAALESKNAELAAQADTAQADKAAAVAQAKLEIQGTLDGLVRAAEEAFGPLEAAIDAGLAAPLAAVIAQARSYTTAAREAAKARRIAELDAERAALLNA